MMSKRNYFDKISTLCLQGMASNYPFSHPAYAVNVCFSPHGLRKELPRQLLQLRRFQRALKGISSPREGLFDAIINTIGTQIKTHINFPYLVSTLSSQ